MRFATGKCTKIRFRRASNPPQERTRRRSLQYSPVPLAGLTGLLLREGEVELKSKGIWGERTGRDEGKRRTLFQQWKSTQICSEALL